MRLLADACYGGGVVQRGGLTSLAPLQGREEPGGERSTSSQMHFSPYLAKGIFLGPVSSLLYYANNLR